MRKIVAGLLISLDGVVESPSEWGFSRYFNDEMRDGIAAGIAQADAVLLGRRTYLEFAALWPKQGSDVLMADFLNNSPKYVVSKTLDRLEWANSSLVTGALAAELGKLKQHSGKNILIPGSPTLVRSLLRDGLLDELSLNICPVVVGSGMRLFDEITDQLHLKLVDSRTLNTGVVGVTYQPASA
ncbi:MAG TPA: dihydrofolate reductase family protein [Candidatus Dormibacteraeota bacterium]|nr:dihydrofolate reductase family protein [Candidatus Dormibacteraeota bacterium]